MAVIITRKNCTLSEANAFYRVESYQVGGFVNSSTYYSALSVPRVIPLTFANAGVFKGIVLTLHVAGVINTDKSVQVELQQSQGNVTLTIASPGKVTKTGHGFTGGEQISFSTTGALPTGLIANTTYYVKYIDANNFNVSSTLNGTNINFTGSQSGTHTLWAVKSYKLLTYAQMTNGINTVYTPTAYNKFLWISDINFTDFSSNVSVTTAVSTWRVTIYQTGGTTGTIGIWNNYDITTYPYYAYCDNQVSFSNNDTVVFAHYCDIDTNATLGGLLGTGDTVHGICGVICSNLSSTSNDDVGFLRCLTPAASYTLTLKGSLIINGRAGIKVGTSTNRISAANRFSLILDTPTVGTVNSAIRGFIGITATAYYRTGRQSIQMYGEYPTTMACRLSQAAETADTKIYVTGDISGWNSGDLLHITKQDVSAVGGYYVYTIQSINGQEITLTTPISTGTSYRRPIGAFVINITKEKYGINLINNSTTISGFVVLHHNTIIIDGAYAFKFLASSGSAQTISSMVYADDTDDYVKQTLYKNIVAVSDNIAIYNFLTGASRVTRKGTRIENFYGVRVQPQYCSSTSWIFGVAYKSGRIEMVNVVCSQAYTGCPGIFNELGYVDGFYNYNQRAGYLMEANGKSGSVFKNIYLYGSACVGGLVIGDGSAVNSTYENIYIDKIAVGFLVTSLALAFGNTFKNIVCGSESVNTADWRVAAGSYFVGKFINCNGITVKEATFIDLSESAAGTKFVFINNDDIQNNDITEMVNGKMVRIGHNLTDQDVHTVGVDKYACRFEPKTYGIPLEWPFEIPTGNIQNKTIIVAAWVKIDSASYWANNYQMPRLTILYDDDVNSAYVEATKVNTWQLITIPITPQTMAKKLKAIFSVDSDAVGADCYVRIDDIGVYYPQGLSLNFGGIDDWSDGEPVGPYISINPIASDVWAYLKSAANIPGSMGAFLSSIATEINAPTKEAIADEIINRDVLTTENFLALK